MLCIIIIVSGFYLYTHTHTHTCIYGRLSRNNGAFCVQIVWLYVRLSVFCRTLCLCTMAKYNDCVSFISLQDMAEFSRVWQQIFIENIFEQSLLKVHRKGLWLLGIYQRHMPMEELLKDMHGIKDEQRKLSHRTFCQFPYEFYLWSLSSNNVLLNLWIWKQFGKVEESGRNWTFRSFQRSSRGAVATNNLGD